MNVEKLESILKRLDSLEKRMTELEDRTAPLQVIGTNVKYEPMPWWANPNCPSPTVTCSTEDK